MAELVSIIIPTYNRSEQLTRAVQSAVNQTYSAIEIIVVNDGGAIQDVEQALSTLEGKWRIVHKEQNAGVSAARNIGVEHAKGKFLLFLDDDDELDSDFLMDALSQREATAEVLIAKALLDTNGNDNHFRKISHYNELLAKQYHHQSVAHWAYFLLYMPAIHAFIFSAMLFRQTRFDETVRYGEDRLLLLELKRQWVTMQSIDTMAGVYHYRHKSVNREEMKLFTGRARTLVNDRKSMAYTYLLDAFYGFKAGQYFFSFYSILRSFRSPYVVVKQFILFLRLFSLR